ncbi:Rieske 2Fe-2S domain-containing protein [Kineosporia sp. J2-2]|uniref:Rieske 2Fe-2S domain-containing protein n=1 Tax=Kineosporia corallincola TaxID=2835133 RepID=A0ABS5THV5_9ACTN|nr:Rieske 2Fe-2S domain-containing protein [Kineosporia corallincola]MBT0770660.1 Rieske 2Fe-2S domain-containing protein [Kineosporia corallincola]
MTTLSTRVVLGPVGQIPPGEGRAFDLGGRMIAVFRLRSGTLRAVPAACPHAGGPLADGQIDDAVLICPLHLNTWDLATGCSRSGQPDLEVLDVWEEDGLIAVSALRG